MKFSNPSLPLRPGEIVEVRKENEILATLDANSTLEGLSFSPEMRKYCEKRFRVFKRVKKIFVEGVGTRHMKNAVTLEGVRCDGEAHGKCRMTCLFIWKESWLKKAANHEPECQQTNNGCPCTHNARATIVNGTISPCQSATLLKATLPVHIWDLRQYIWDITSGAYLPLERLRLLMSSLRLKALEILVDRPNVMFHGNLRRTPVLALNLQHGEAVAVKSREEILATLDSRGRNRGLAFTPEMSRYCGGEYRVLKRIDKMINVRTGKMRQIANTVLLEEVTCDGKAHSGCPRTCYCLWREIWLKRVDDP